MNRETSTYLDLCRFTAACIVLSVHSFGEAITGGFLWQLGAYGQTAVMIFFVLSGYVISYVSDQKEHSLTAFMTARFARLYSVVVPALILTAICNYLGNQYGQAAYFGPWQVHDDSVQRSFVTLFMLQDIWSQQYNPTNNGAFWSISFEFFYYLLFALFVYLRQGYVRWVVLAITAVIAGPIIVAMFPIWLLGCLAYHLHKRGRLFTPIVAWPVFVASIIIIITSPDYRALTAGLFSLNRESLIGDYIDGIAFFFHLLAVPVVVAQLSRPLLTFRRAITFCAGFTFAMYLFHLPLIRLFSSISPFISEPASWQNRVFILGLTLAVIVLIGLPAERLKRPMARWIHKGLLKFEHTTVKL